MMVLVLTTLMAGCGGDNKTPATSADKSTPPATSSANNEQPGASAWGWGQRASFPITITTAGTQCQTGVTRPANSSGKQKVKINAISSGGRRGENDTILISGELPDTIGWSAVPRLKSFVRRPACSP